MKAPVLAMAAAFLVTSIPTALLLQHYDIGGDYRLLIAMAVGALASSLAQTALQHRGDKS
jgi:hypothetical protein